MDTYDMDGNVYGTSKIYDHLPTSLDSALFYKYADSAITTMIVDCEKRKNPKPMINKKKPGKPKKKNRAKN